MSQAVQCYLDADTEDADTLWALAALASAGTGGFTANPGP